MARTFIRTLRPLALLLCGRYGAEHRLFAYRITTRRSSFSEGWFLTTDDEFTQLSVKPLVMVPTYPPRFIHNEIFKIVPVHHHD
ncbi:hypothetical protein FA13DRAFT_1743937 [Coprinellus micaceus]|uniref:Uncharacterized protein n=1 Tax=Coprinellus micaceus TaxID=71717 RepID=A0A4Y7SDM5_COPMI|nr:hypothetical protein FA13DRAFT_1743937 [Coprinellus micaceus]